MATSVRKSSSFDPLMNHLALGDLDALGEGAQVIAAVAAAIDTHPLAGGRCESLHHLRRDRLMGGAFEHSLRPLGIGPGLVSEGA